MINKVSTQNSILKRNTSPPPFLNSWLDSKVQSHIKKRKHIKKAQILFFPSFLYEYFSKKHNKIQKNKSTQHTHQLFP